MSFVNGFAQGLGSSGGLQAAGGYLNGKVNATPAPTFDPNTTPAGLGVLKQENLPPAHDPGLGADGQFHPFADASHPFWDVMQAAAGPGAIPAPQAGALPPAAPAAPAAPGGPMPGLEGGGPVPDHRATQTAFLNGGPAPAPRAPLPPVPQTAHQAVREAFLSGIPVAGHAGGGVVPEFMHTLPQAGIIPASTEGQILTMDAGGVVPEGFVAPASNTTPAVSGRAAGLASGFSQGVTIGHDLRNAYLQRKAHQAAAEYGDTTLGIDSENQGAQDQPSILGRAKNAVEGFFHHLHLGTLNDQHTPNGDQGVPGAPPADESNPAPGAPPAGAAPPAAATPPLPTAPNTPPAGGVPVPAAGAPAAPAPTTQQVATITSVKAAAKNPETQQGIPQASPSASGKPHSLTTDYWQDSQKKLLKAVHAAALAGEDPSKVYESLTAMRTAHFQGQIVRNLGAAHVALMNGDQDAVKQALSNVNYYLPNGKGINFKNSTQADVDAGAAKGVGQLMYRNPFYGLYGHDKEPEYTSVTQEHIELLGQAALDPTNVQKTILASYEAQSKARKEDLTAEGALLTGQGRAAWGQAQVTKANIDARNEVFHHYVEFSRGEANEAYANAQNAKAKAARTGTGPKIPMSAYQHAASSAATAVTQLAQGYQTTAPVMVPKLDDDGKPVMGPDGKPVMSMNLSPAAGKSVRDPTKVPTDFKGYTPDDTIQVQNLASHIAGANVDIAPNDAALVAAKIYQYKTGRRWDEGAQKLMQDGADTGRHMDPVHHKVVRNVIPEPNSDILNVWMGNGWRQIHMNANIADDSSQGINVEQPPEGGNPADNEPAVDSGPMNDDNQ